MADRLESVVRVICALCDGAVDSDDLTLWVNRILDARTSDSQLSEATDLVVAALGAARVKAHSAARGSASAGTATARVRPKKPRTTT